MKVINAESGYLSSLVMAFRRRKSPHTRHELSRLVTACIGDAQLDSHRTMTLQRSHCRSCSSICVFLSPCSCRHGVYTGGPSVAMYTGGPSVAMYTGGPSVTIYAGVPSVATSRGVVIVTTLLKLGSTTSGNSVHNLA